MIITSNRMISSQFDLLTQNDILKEKLTRLDDTNHSVEGGQLKTVWMMESWSISEYTSEYIGVYSRGIYNNVNFLLIALEIIRSYLSIYFLIDIEVNLLKTRKKRN